MPSVATLIQNPDVVGVPAPRAQNVAIWTCSAVRVSEICRISASPARKPADPNAGGGAERNWLAEVRNQGRTPGNCPPAAPGLVVAVPVALSGFGLLYGQILCDAEEGVGASRNHGGQVRLPDERCRGPLPPRTRQPLRRGNAVARSGNGAGQARRVRVGLTGQKRRDYGRDSQQPAT